MLLQTLAWRAGTGWSAPWPEGMDSPQTLAVMFGGKGSSECQSAIAEVAARLPRSVLAGCSTAGEIFDAQVQDASLSVAIAHFAGVALRKVVMRIDAGRRCACPRTRARRGPGRAGPASRLRAERRTQRERQPADCRAERSAARGCGRDRRARRRRRAIRRNLGTRRERARRSLRYRSRLLRRATARGPRLPRRLVELRTRAHGHAIGRQRSLRARRQARARALQELPRRARDRAPRHRAAVPARDPPRTTTTRRSSARFSASTRRRSR